jgi:hypothetical protein
MSSYVSERCPGCGSVVSDRFQSCRPIAVDVTQPGYRYLADTWGYCLHEGRHIDLAETPWLDRTRASLVVALEELADEWDACDEHGNPLREGSLGEAADDLRAVLTTSQEDHR